MPITNGFIDTLCYTITMKRPELPPVVDRLIDPLKKETVLLSALTDFTQNYSEHLISLVTESGESAFDTDVIQEHQHALNCIETLTQFNDEITNGQKAQLWWCAEDLIIHLRMYQPELVSSHHELFNLLNAIQHLLEPNFPRLSKKAQREQLCITWFRKQFELKNIIGPESINGGSNTLGRWIKAITESLEADNPTKAQNLSAHWAAGGLLELIAKTKNPLLNEFVPLLKQIRHLAK